VTNIARGKELAEMNERRPAYWLMRHGLALPTS
jgi:hypothetical protein